ncbi:hypothetical protein DPX16_17726 [Anabarilius grahami]|uniref:Uncharacterized protein n=1 Tax=Anabarilius grahami TaxID=495550 RepID=A0A3N0YIA2_ANAGA|nr:hypothetical protein DPX16_17726 [Anabarilius grahami]
MTKVWRQVLESHCEKDLQRKDIFTTLLSQCKKNWEDHKSAINLLETEKALQNGAPMWPMSWIRSSYRVLTSEESLDKMQSMAEGLMESEWTDRGMLVRHDVFHWIHRFDAAVSPPKANIHQDIYGQNGFENHTFQELYSQYSVLKDRPDDFSSSQEGFDPEGTQLCLLAAAYT